MAPFAFAGPGRTTYQAKIIKPDGNPLEATSVNFKFTIMDAPATCVLYSETYSSVNMNATGGLISFSLGAGVKTYPVSGTTFAQVFSNITPNLACDAAGTPTVYTPTPTDGRKIIMQFNDGNGWQTLPAMTINAVPYAMYADDSTKFNGMVPSDFVQVSTIPTCTASEALRYTGASFNCVAVGSGGTSVTSSTVITALGYTPADGASVTTLTSNLGSVSSTVASVSSTVYAVSGTVSTLASSVAASFSAITSSQWTTSGANIYYDSGNVGIGTSSPISRLTISDGSTVSTSLSTTDYALFAAQNTAPTFSIVTADGTSAPTNRSVFKGVRARGTLESPLPPVVDDHVLSFLGAIYDGSTTQGSAMVSFLVDGAVSPGIAPERIGFYTSTTGAASRVERVTIKSTGLVGIGTTNPVAKLDVSGAIRIGYENNCSANYAGTIRYNGGGLEYCNGSSWNTLGVAGSGLNLLNGSASSTQSFAIAENGNSPAFLTANGVHTLNIPLASAAGSVTAGLISNDDYTTFMNKVTSSAASVLQILGYTPANSATVNTLDVRVTTVSNVVTTIESDLSAVSATANSKISSQWTTSGTNIFYNSGNVGVGTSNPTNRLEVVAGASQNALRILTDHGQAGINVDLNSSNAGDSTRIAFQSYRVSGGALDYAGVGAHDGKLVLSGNGNPITTPQMAIDNSGNVGIGTSSPAARLHVVDTLGGMFFDGTNANYNRIKSTSSTANSGRDLMFTTQGAGISPDLYISSSGNVAIGINAPTAKLHLSSGTTSVAPFKFTSGTLLTAAQSGTMEYDGFNFYLTDGAGARKAISLGSSAGSIDNASTINSTGNIAMVPVGSVVVSSTTASTNSQTGSLIVKGGLGISGNIYSSGTIITSSDIQGASITATNGVSTTVVQGTPYLLLNPNGGNVGIGVSTAAYPLDVSGVTMIRGSNGGNVLRLAGTYDGTTATHSYLSFYNSATTTRSGFVGFGSVSDNNLTIANQKSADIILSTSGSTRMTIASTGAVGIGNANPTALLDVQSANATNNIMHFKRSDTGAAWAFSLAGGDFRLGRSSGSGNILLGVDAGGSASGNVGIGTATPTALLHVYGTSGAQQLKVENTDTTSFNQVSIIGENSNAYLIGRHNNSGMAGTSLSILPLSGWVGTGSADSGGLVMNTAHASAPIIFATGGNALGNERMRLASGGNFGIGTSAPTHIVHAYKNASIGVGFGSFNASNASVRIQEATGNGLYMDGNSVLSDVAGSMFIGTLQNYPLQFGTSNTQQMTLSPSGLLGIGTTNPLAHVHMSSAASDITLMRFTTANTDVIVGEDQDIPGIIRFRPMTGSGVAITGANDTPGIFVQSGTSYVGVGGTLNPTAFLHIRAGLSTVAPLKFTSGTLMTAAQAGAMEFDGFNFYLTDGAGARKAISLGSTAGSIDNASIINSTGNITMVPVGSVVVSSTTTSTNSQTGALVVKGGLGVAGNIYASGTIVTSANIQGSSITATAGVSTTVIQGTPYLALNPNGGNVGIGTSAPLARVHVSNGSNVGSAPHSFSDLVVEDDAEGMILIKTPSNQSAYYGFSDDNDDFVGGIQYDHASDSMMLRVNNQNTTNPSIYLVSGGAVGIGTATPSGLLDIYSAGGRYQSFSSNGRVLFAANDNTVTPALNLRNTYDTAGHGVGINFDLGYGGTNGISGTAVTGAKISAIAENTFTSTASTQDAALQFATTINGNLTEKMRIDSSGYVGIGTSTPSSLLHLKDNAAVILTVERSNSQNSLIEYKNTLGSMYSGIITTTNSFGIGSGNDLATSNVFVLTNTGRLGLGSNGTLTPTAKLQITSGTSSVAPIKLSSGALLASPQSGTIEYDGFDFYITDSNNVRRAIATESSMGTLNDVSVVSSTSGITLWPAANNSVTVSATTASTNSNTGALIVKGGLGVAGTANIAGNLNVSGSSVIDGTLKLSAMTSGSVLLAGANGTVVQDNSNFFWDGANKRLGIGTTTPSYVLDVSGSIQLKTNASYLRYVNTSGAGGRVLGMNSSNVTYFGDIDNVSSGGVIVTSFGGDMSITMTSAGVGTRFYTSGTERMRIDTVGNIGIGTNAPNGPLDISGSTNGGTVPQVTISNPYDTSTSRMSMLGFNHSNGKGAELRAIRATSNSNGMSLAFLNQPTAGGSLVERMRIDESGYVGIGTNNPTSLLHIYMAASNTLQMPLVLQNNDATDTGGSATSLGFRVANTAAAKAAVAFERTSTNGRGSLHFLVNATGDTSTAASLSDARMTITTAGAVGIGTSVPTASLDVKGGDLVVRDEGGNTIIRNIQYGSSGYPAFYAQKASGTMTVPAANAADTTIMRLLGESYDGSAFGGRADINFKTEQATTASAQGTYITFGTTASGTSPTNPTERMRISASGAVGIGTTTPSSLLHVDSNFTAPGLSEVVRFVHRRSDIADNDGSYLSLKVVDANNTGDTFDHARISWKNGGDGVSEKHGELAFWTANDAVITERMTITRLGYVGIGTTAPAYVLDVSGSARVAGNLGLGSGASPTYRYIANEINGAGGYDISFYNSTSGNASGAVNFKSSTAGTTWMTVQNSGNVGIGTSAPANRLEVIADAATNNTFNKAITVGVSNGGNQGGWIGSRTSAANQRQGLMLSSNQTLTLHGDNSGDGSSVLDVLGGSSPDIPGDTDLLMRVMSTGNVGIGTTAPAYLLDVSGTVNIASGSALRFGGTQICSSAGCTATSDERLKENIKPLDFSLEKILALQPVQYDWKNKAIYGEKHQIGFIAQQLERIFPEVVYTDKETGIKTVSYGNLIAPLVQAFKELFKETKQNSRDIASLKEENAQLKTQNEKQARELQEMKERMERLEKAILKK